MTPRLVRLAGAALGGFALVVVTVLAVGAARSASDPDPEGTRAYAEAIEQVALEAGSVIELEMKPGISDVREEVHDPDVLAGFAEHWVADLIRLRDDLRARKPPTELGEAHAGYLAALDGYREVAEILAAAPHERGSARDALLERAMDLGEQTDQVWNSARDQLRARLDAHGLTDVAAP
jgi:hypothetical protein